MRNAIFKFLAKRIEKNTRLRKTRQSFVGSDGPDGVRQLAIGRDQLVRARVLMSHIPVAEMNDLPAGKEVDGDGDRDEDSVCLGVL